MADIFDKIEYVPRETTQTTQPVQPQPQAQAQRKPDIFDRIEYEYQPGEMIGMEFPEPEPTVQPKPEIPPRQYEGFFPEAGRALARGSLGVGSALAGVVEQITPYEGTLAWDSGTMEEISESLREKAQSPKWRKSEKGGVKGFIANAVGETIPFMFGTAAATVAGGPAGGFAFASSVEGHNSYQEARESGMSESKAQLVGALVGAVNGALEMLQVKGVIKGGKQAIKEASDLASKNAFRKIAKATGKITAEKIKMAAEEGLEEAVQEVVGITVPAVAKGEMPDIEESAKQVGEAFVGGATAGVILGSGFNVIESLSNKGKVQQNKDGSITLEAESKDQVDAIISEAEATSEATGKDFKADVKGNKVTISEIISEEPTVSDVAEPAIEQITPAEPMVTPEIAPEAVTQEAVTPEPAITPEVTPVTPEPTISARQEDIQQERQAMGLTEIDSHERKSWQTSIDNAISKKIPEKSQRIASEVNEKPRALNDEETAGLVVSAAKLKTEHSNLMKQIAQVTDPGEVKTLSMEAARVENEFDNLSRAIHTSGTEKGRALAAQKLTIDQDYNLVSVLSRAKAAKGKELNSGQRNKLEKLTFKLEESNQKIEILQNQVNELMANSFVKQGGVKRYRRMNKQQKDMELSALNNKLNTLLSEGCYS